MTTKTIGSGLGSNATGSGTVTATNLSTSVVGLTTLFTSEFIVGGAIGIDNVSYQIASITNDTHLALTANYAGGTGSTKTIQLGARNYKSVSAWASYVNALTLSAAEVGECYNDSEFTETALVTIGGWTGGSATNTVTLKCGAGQSFRDNASVQSNALRYNQTNGVGINWTTTYINAVSLTTSYTILDGLQLKGSGTNTESAVNVSATNCTLQNLVMQFKPRTSAQAVLVLAGSGNTCTIQNCVIYCANATARGILDATAAGTNTFSDLTIVGASSSGVGVRTAYQPGVFKNCAVFGFTTDYSGTAGAASTNNCTDKGTFGGTNFGGSGQTSAVATTELYSVTAGSEDFRVNTTSVKLKDNGVTAGPSTDIAGTSRPQGSAYDIGCWELVSSGITATVAQSLTKPSQALATLITYNATATVAQSLFKPTLSATAVEIFGAVVAQSFVQISQAAIGVLSFSGAVAQTFQKPTQAAAGAYAYLVTASVGQTLLPFSQLAAGALSFTATAAQTLPQFSQSVVGIQGAVASVAQLLLQPTQVAAGAILFTANVAQTFQKPTQAVVTYYLGPSAVAQTLTRISMSVAGVYTPSATAATIAQVLIKPAYAAVGKAPPIAFEDLFFSWRTD